MQSRRSLLRSAGTLFALSAFAVAEPIFDVLSRTPEFLLVRRSDAVDVLVLVGVVSLGPTAVLALLEWMAGLLGEGARRLVHVGTVTCFLVIMALPPLNRNVELSPLEIIGVAAAIGLFGGVSYARLPVLRAFAVWLVPAGLLFPALFLFRPPTSTIVFEATIHVSTSQAHDATPVVMLVFDEFPLSALVDAEGEIDPVLFPNFARLGKDATWFRDATTIASMTPPALAAILTGTMQGRTPLSVTANRTRNLFTLLAADHDLNVVESYVPFCPATVCAHEHMEPRRVRLRMLLRDTGIVFLHVVLPASWAVRLPNLTYASLLLRDDSQADGADDLMRLGKPIGDHWKSTPEEREAVVARFISSIRPSPRGTFNYLHVLLPHVPYAYEPSGRICSGWARPGRGRWYRRGTGSAMQQRLLLQVGWVDRVIGQLVAHLEDVGLYDRALLVIVADHGISFRPHDERRALTTSNACDIMSVPLFIKAPRQRAGGVNDENVEVIDILPTVAGLLGITVPWPVDGRMVLSPTVPRPAKVFVGPWWPREGRLPWRNGRLSFASDFGLHCQLTDHPTPEVAWGKGPHRIFRVGPYGGMLGRRVRSSAVTDDVGIRVRLFGDDLSAPVAEDARYVPCVVEGEVTVANGSAHGLDLAVAVNGRVAGLGRSDSAAVPARAASTRTSAFSIAVPWRAFGAERNVVKVFVLQRDEGRVRFVPTKDEGDQRRHARFASGSAHRS